MTRSTRPDSWELADYRRALRRRWKVVFLFTCIGLLLAGAAIKLLPKTYTASASVYVNALPTDSSPAKGGATSVDMDNEAQIAQSGTVSRVASRQLGSKTGSITVSVPPNTTVLDISCDASSANRAAACANAVALGYLSTRRSTAASTFSSELAALRSKGVSLLPGVVQAQLQQHQTTTSTQALSTKITKQLEAKAANNQLDQIVSRINFLTTELAALESPTSTMAGHVINRAGPPSSPTSPKKTLILPSGLVAGLIIGLIVALWREVRDERLYDPRDVERVYELPTLVDLRAKRGRANKKRGAAGAWSVQAFAELADYVATTPTEGSLVVVVAGTSPEEGTSAVAAKLAAALSEARPDVVLVSAGPGATLVPQLLGLEHHSGLVELLIGNVSLDEAAQVPGHLLDLRVIGPGADRVGNVRHNYDARRKLMADLQERARYVIVEAPLRSGESGSTPLTLGEFGDSAIVVIESRSTKRSAVDALLGHLQRIRVPVLGTVMIPRPERAGMPSLQTRRAAEGEPGQVAIQA